jgi:hypothetical protein
MEEERASIAEARLGPPTRRLPAKRLAQAAGVYLGWHWPSDVLAGALLGAAFAAGAIVPAYGKFVWRWAGKAWEFKPGLVAGCVFLICYEITDLFDAPISILMLLVKHKH